MRRSFLHTLWLGPVLWALPTLFPLDLGDPRVPDTQESSTLDPAAEVLAVVRDWNAAFAANDIERYFSFVHPDITVMTPSHPYRVEGREQDREEFGQGLKTGRTRVNFFQMMHPKVQVQAGTAVVTYFWRGSLGPEPTRLATFKETDVFVRGESGWKLWHVHLSRSTDS